MRLITIPSEGRSVGLSGLQRGDLLDTVAEMAEALLESSHPVEPCILAGGSRFRVLTNRIDGSKVLLVLLVDDSHKHIPSIAVLMERFGLTPREAQVAVLLAQRESNKEIARLLSVTVFTAERHTEKVLSKLGINSRRHVLAALTTIASDNS